MLLHFLSFLCLHFRSEVSLGKVTWTDEKIAANEDHKEEKMRKPSLKTIIKIPRHTKSITDDKADLKEQGVQKNNKQDFIFDTARDDIKQDDTFEDVPMDQQIYVKSAKMFSL